MARTNDLDYFAAGFGAKARAAPRPMSTGSSAKMADVKLFAVTGAKRMGTSASHTVVFMVPAFPGDDNTVLPLMGAALQHNGRTARFDRVRMNAEDRAAKRNTNQKVARDPAGHYDLTLGTYFEYVITKDDKFVKPNEVKAHTLYSAGINEVLEDSYLGVTRTSFKICSFARVATFAEMSPAAHAKLLAAYVHAAQLVPELVPLMYTGGNMTIEELKKAKADFFTPETRHMRNANVLMPFVHAAGNAALARARCERGESGVFWKDDLSMSLANDEQWPHEGMKDNAKVLRAATPFQLDGMQFMRREGAPPPALPVSGADICSVFDTRNVTAKITMMGSALYSFGVCHDEHWYEHGALRYLVYHTPAAGPTYLSSPAAQARDEMPGDVALQFTTSGKSDDTSGTVMRTFVADGVVNAGYPVDKDSVLAILDTMGAENERYRRNMGSVPNRCREQKFSRDTETPANPLEKLIPTKCVFNVLECNENIEALADDDWAFFVIPNMAPKDTVAGNDTPGLAHLRAVAARHGGDMVKTAADMGAVFRSLVADGRVAPECGKDAAAAFKVPKGRVYNHLVFAVGRRYMATRNMTPLTVHNHADFIAAYFKQYYPDDLSDMPAAASSSTASPARKHIRGDDADEPTAKPGGTGHGDDVELDDDALAALADPIAA